MFFYRKERDHAAHLGHQGCRDAQPHRRGRLSCSARAPWDAFADPRQLERFWGPPFAPATFTRHDLRVGGRAEYFLTGPKGERGSGSWKFTAVNPPSSFEALDGDDNAEDENMPAAMKFAFETTPTDRA